MQSNGHIHPLTQFMRKSLKYFQDRGFSIYEGPEIETEWNNFDALNVPANHPSRDVQDTFWLKGEKKVLRTHTTGSEIRIVKEKGLKPPFKIVVPGRVFRNEATDATHEHTLNQLDGMAIDKDLNMKDLMGLLTGYMKEIFGDQVKTRFRLHLYPFVEPGMDLDIQMPDGTWREMLGSGMAHPVVLKNMGIDPEKWQGIMWGMGVDRYAMQEYGIEDIRHFSSGDLRFLKQF